MDKQILATELAHQLAPALWILLQASKETNEPVAENEIYITCHRVLVESLNGLELIDYERIADLLLDDRKIARKLMIAFLRGE